MPCCSSKETITSWEACSPEVQKYYITTWKKNKIIPLLQCMYCMKAVWMLWSQFCSLATPQWRGPIRTKKMGFHIVTGYPWDQSTQQKYTCSHTVINLYFQISTVIILVKLLNWQETTLTLNSFRCYCKVVTTEGCNLLRYLWCELNCL